ncbi:unnamed protein product [Phytomonas sp. Hart1]|nr:unnamed protein product [Phytomonas sp. Hart1]|eukprot:CCW66155.1 unnamed protein product [Phytomonas sp. isolate Hart1]
MHRAHYALWERCQKFVHDVCLDRGPSHGYTHMNRVTEQAILLYHLNADSREANPESTFDLYAIILVAMLHDVADHKYDSDGVLALRLLDFVTDEVAQWIQLAHDPLGFLLASNAQPLGVLQAVLTNPARIFAEDDAAMLRQQSLSDLLETIFSTIKAVSYSVENKKGMGWFKKVLPPRWLAIRNVVSDADKLDALGEDGLMRSYAYVCETYQEKCFTRPSNSPGEKPISPEKKAAIMRLFFDEVRTHFRDKLSRLPSLFIVTSAGKFLATSRYEAMVTVLEDWELNGPPPIELYWPTVDLDWVD